jgi:hypothetical protein
MKRSSEVIAMYVSKCREFVNATINYFKDLHRQDKENNHTIQTDIKNFFEKYDSSFNKMIDRTYGSDKNRDKVSLLFEAFYNHGPKMLNIIFNILKSPGSALVYSNYVEMEGLQIFKVYLSFFGFISIDDDKEFNNNEPSKKTSKTGLRFMEFHGGIDKDLREKNKKIFNIKDNKIGDVIKIIMISPAGAEGINLNNCRQVHILEPYWNEVRIEQVIGRAVRQCHHKELPMKERTVDVFRYKMVRDVESMKKSMKSKDNNSPYENKNNKLIVIKTETSDEMMENISRRKNNLLISFIEAIKEAAVDCELFKAHNMMGSKYSCFKFNEDALFDKNVGPAYNPDIEIDGMMDNGLNAIDSIKKRIKVRKIKAVKKIDDNNYSEELNAWFYEKSGTVYDNELDYPIGKVGKDSSGNYLKLDKDVYIMDKVINIPIFKLYN